MREMARIASDNSFIIGNTTLGFMLRKKDFKEIVVLKGSLDRVMVVVGHEIGHAITPALPDSIDEEAKAFAFQAAWVKALKDNDIGGLDESLRDSIQPAQNGLHDRALAYVKDKLQAGLAALSIFFQLSDNAISHTG
jgi:hypothetical protein